MIMMLPGVLRAYRGAFGIPILMLGGITMLEWLSNNLSTIVITLVLIVICGAIIRSMIRDKKSGKSSCGGNCGSCGGCSACHPKK